jgi:plastocyanin
MTNSRAAVIGLSVAALAAIAIGRVSAFADPYSSSASSASPAPAASPALVTIKDFAFSPSTVSIPVGGSVTWKNLDQAAHTATDAKMSFDSGNLDTGKTFTHTFTKAGTYQIVCTYHPSMHGTVIVGASASPSPATPSSSGY